MWMVREEDDVDGVSGMTGHLQHFSLGAAECLCKWLLKHTRSHTARQRKWAGPKVGRDDIRFKTRAALRRNISRRRQKSGFINAAGEKDGRQGTLCRALE